MIKIFNIYKSYPPNVSVLNNFNLHIKPGEFVSIVGKSGAGKTTLIKILTGQERADDGQVVVGDWDITKIKKKEVPFLRRQIGVIYQDFKLLSRKNLEENVAFALQVCGKQPTKIKSIVPKVMKVVGLESRKHCYPHEVSGGEKQRASIARALVHSPKILLADEPTGNVDSINADEIIDLLLKINRFGTTVVLVSHNREIINKLRRRVVTIENGEVISDQEKGKYIL